MKRPELPVPGEIYLFAGGTDNGPRYRVLLIKSVELHPEDPADPKPRGRRCDVTYQSLHSGGKEKTVSYASFRARLSGAVMGPVRYINADAQAGG